MDWRKEIKETVQYIIIGIVLAYSLNFGLSYALESDKPVMAVVSDSMEPVFYKGDLVVVRGVNPEEIREGEIIVYHYPLKGIDIVHRVVGFQACNSETCFITKGDNNYTNPRTDQDSGIAPPVKKNWVVGRVVLIVPKLGWVTVIKSMILS